MSKCVHCGKECGDEVVTVKQKWVSWGPCRSYASPLVSPCHKTCKGEFLGGRSRQFAVLDETMNTHRDFVRVEGQSGYFVAASDGETLNGNLRRPYKSGDRVHCQGWRSASEVGLDYVPSLRYINV